MNFKITCLIVSAISVFNTLIAADRDSAEPSGHRDTIRVYKLGDISITGNNSDHMLTKSNINSVSYNQIQRSDAATASEMQLYLPSARIKSNSRSEYLLFLRGAGERQLGLFFDGVPLNIAWDNRFDLSLLPMDIMGKVDVNKNASSILYGPNVLGGAVNISTYERATKGIGGKIKLQGGDGPIMQSSLTVDGKLDNFNFIGSVSYSKSDGLIIPDEHPSTLLHQDTSSSLIKNSDRRFLSVYGRAEYEFSGTDRIGLSVININGEKGVSPEMHLDDQSARFWRYPDWSRTMIASNMNFGLNSTNSFELKGTVWADFFNQQIASFSNADYSGIASRQNDNDRTIGGRFLLDWKITSDQTLGYVVNLSNSNHIEEIDNSGVKDYSQYLLSSGMNYTFSNNKLLFRAGALLDILKTGLAGDFESEEGKMLADWGAFANAKILLNSNLTLFGNLSRRTRFPTMRESYSGALNKFKANPGLKPETGILSELGINWQNEDIYFELAGFANFFNGLIDQIRLSPSDDSLKRRMRVNLSDAEIYGIDINARFQITDNLNLQGSIIFMNSRGKTADGVTNHLNNRPEILAGLIAEYSFTSALRLLIEMETTGRQFEMSPEDNAQYIEIESSSILNIRASYRLPEILGSISELSLRVNNVFDTYRLYQLGLPEPGRTLSAGLMINL